MRIVRDGFEYLFDFSSELVTQSVVASQAVADRIVAAQGALNRREEAHGSFDAQTPLGPAGFIRMHSVEPSKLSAV